MSQGDILVRSSLNSAGGLKDFLEYKGAPDGMTNVQHPSLLPRVSMSQSNLRLTNKSFRTNLDSATKNPTSRGIMRQAEILDENRIVLFKKGKQVGRGYYIIEISSNNESLYIAAYDVESPESFLIELPERKAQEILTHFNNNYEEIASAL